MSKNPSGKDKKLEIVTDPREIHEIFKNEGAHRRSLEESARRNRVNRITAKFLDKAMSGKLFNIVWHKVESIEDVSSALLRGHVMHSRDKDGEYYTLGVEVDYAKLYKLNPDKREIAEDPKQAFKLEFNQHRATSFSAGSFESMRAAKAHMHLMDQYLMHILAEAGAENTRLELDGHKVTLRDVPETTGNNQSYSDALRTARLIQAFRTNLIDTETPDFRQVIGNLLGALAMELQLPFERQEKVDDDKTVIKLVFDRDIGEFSFSDNSEETNGKLVHQLRTGQEGKQRKTRFECELTSSALQEQFIDWLAAAARERGTISEEGFANLNGKVQSVGGIPLRSSKLGLLAPFDTTGYSRFGKAGPSVN